MKPVEGEPGNISNFTAWNSLASACSFCLLGALLRDVTLTEVVNLCNRTRSENPVLIHAYHTLVAIEEEKN